MCILGLGLEYIYDGNYCVFRGGGQSVLMMILTVYSGFGVGVHYIIYY